MSHAIVSSARPFRSIVGLTAAIAGFWGIASSAQAAIQPSTQRAAQPTIRPATQPAIRPATEPATQPAIQPAIRPAIRPATQPAPPESPPVAESAPHAADFPRGAVAADHPLASAAGADMLRAGGNAVDAAVAASFVLSVVRPYSCGIGGGGFMIVHRPANGDEPAMTAALDYRETAPAAVGETYYRDMRDAGIPGNPSRNGATAVGVPGTVSGLLLALDRWGTLPRADVLAPAIAIARDGWLADASHVSAARGLESRLAAAPQHLDDAAWIRGQLTGLGEIQVGAPLTNAPQARVLERIAAEGASGFYAGPVAAAIVAAIAPRGGALTAEDLAAYQPRDLEPVRGTYRGRTVLAMPPPSSGGVAMIQTLGLLERVARRDAVDVAGGAWGSPPRLHVLTESLKHAFADRAEWLADPDFVDVPVDALLGPEYLDLLARRIDPERTQPTSAYGSAAPPPMDSGTSHLSVVDASGMAVACTETINMEYGSMLAVAGYGFVLNNEMDDFTAVAGEVNAYGLRQSERNLPRPGQRPLSSMSPTIVLDADGAVELVAGASGGPRIITGTLQVMLNVLDHGFEPADAVERPRMHHQWLPDTLQFERRWDAGGEGSIPEAELAALGHTVGLRGDVGVVQLIVVQDGTRRAVSDPRKGGRPAGH
ncbi:MAG: gamma-glutamyltransferase [Phycisphaerales bacterium]